MLLTFLISTFNRREALLGTLRQLQNLGLGPADFEIIVIDNASADGTADAVTEQHPGVRLVRLARNRGAVAKNEGLKIARGQYVVFLDDDSYPSPGSIERMIEHFAADSRLGAAVFTITLPNGTQECSAYPNVCIGCGTGFRRAALDEVGGLPNDFFMQAEEYDLSLRLLDAGWGVRRFDDLHVTHLKTPAARFPARVMRLDVRNNLVLIARYFPRRWVIPFAVDWMRRYWLIARANGRRRAYARGLAEGILRAIVHPRRRAVSDAMFEQFAKVDQIRERLGRLAEAGHRRVLLIDLGKNCLPYWLAAKQAGLTVVAIADKKLGGKQFKYHGISIVEDTTAASLPWDVAVVANLSPVHANVRLCEWTSRDARPVIDFFAEASSPTADLSTRQAA